MFYLYIITNVINGKKYIGLTNNIARRWYEHRVSQKDSLIGRAIGKYGEDNFLFEVLGTFVSKEEVSNAEIEAIKANQSHISTGLGYNVSRGGETGSYVQQKPVWVYSTDGEFVARYESVSECARKIGAENSNVSICARGIINVCKGFCIFYQEQSKDWFKGKMFGSDAKREANKDSMKTVWVYTKDGLLIDKYDSIHECAERLGIEISAVSQCVNQKMLSFNDMCFFAVEQSKDWFINRKFGQDTFMKDVWVYTKKGDFVATYPSLKECSKELGFKSSRISSCLTGEKNSYKGHLFFYEKPTNEELLKKRTAKGVQREISGIDKVSGELIEFKCMKDANDYFGKPVSKHIVSCCNGNRKSAYGYYWCYKED
ncbi:NUMOD1 domain-containing DNA-binding protein [Cytobacillus kochii]|uniref:NUMOD1 domain-containing DNA-binding protein n=1 Tax=Cytobacillus kochii TaxID=859143 RepID=UPI002040BB89|nr:NUMOD1 domain-containing DNA-binding protein [Cytobacillus kochii]MCM3347423.1 NUMOD1 domain-containing DNA-binding protein [Cytobacillus kochii]